MHGLERRPLRADLEDSPRARGRRLRRGHRDGAVRPLPRAGRAPSRTTAGRPRPSRRTPSSWPRASIGLAKTPFRLAGRALGALQHPGRDARSRCARRPRAWARWSGPGLNPAPDVPLNVEIGPHRRVRWVQSRLADFKEIKNALGGTVNDAVLAVVAGALRRWLRDRGVRTEGSSCARSCRCRSAATTSAARSATGSRRCAGRCPSTSTTRSSASRSCVRRMGELKESKQALGAEVIAGLTGLRPAHAAGSGVAAQLLDPAVQPDRDERAGPAVPALPARARDGGDRPDRVPAREPRARGRDHELQRQGRLRPARGLRRDAGHRRLRQRTSRSRSRSCSPRRGRPRSASAKANGSKKDGTPGRARKKTPAS